MSSSIIGGVIGGVIGFFTPLGPYYGYAIGSAIGGAVDYINQPDRVIQGPRLEDLRAQSSEYGRPIPIVKGTVAVAGNVIWQTDIVEVIKTEETGGGKGGPSTTSTTYTYFANFAIALCEGPVAGVCRIWAGPGKVLIYDVTPTSLAPIALEGGLLRVYKGDETQLPDPLIEANLGIGNVPAYRGTAYMVFEMLPLAKHLNTIPFLTVEVAQVGVRSSRCVDIRVFAGEENEGYFGNQVAFSPAGELWARRYSPGPIDDLVRIDSYTGTVVESFPNLSHVVFGAILGFAANGKMWLEPTSSQTLWLWTPGTPLTAQVKVTNPFLPDIVRLKNHRVFVGNEMWFWNGDGFTRDFITCADAETATITKNIPNAQFGVGSGLALTTDGTYLYGATINKYYKIDIASATIVFEIAHGNLQALKNLTYYNGYVYALITTTLFGGHIERLSLTDFSLVASSIQIAELSGIATLILANAAGTVITGAPGFDAACYEIDLNSMTVLSTVTGWHAGNHARLHNWNVNGGITQDPITGRLIKSNHFDSDESYRLQTFLLGGLGGLPVVLSDCVADLCSRAGLSPAQYDVTALTDMVDGYPIAKQTSVRNAIEPLQKAYYFDATESDGEIRFVKRGGVLIAVIPDDDLGAVIDGQEEAEPLKSCRRMENELPKSLNINYMMAGLDYAPATKVSKHLVGASGEQMSLEVPVVLTEQKAQEVADVNLFTAWSNRLTYAFTLPRKYGALEPSDLVSVKGKLIRITSIHESPTGIISVEGMSDDVA